MTNEQKIKIIRLRAQGLSYPDISRELNIPKDTVKSFCRRNSLTVSRNDQTVSGSGQTVSGNDQTVSGSGQQTVGKPSIEGKDRCRECGNPITQQLKTKRRIFCSKACREKWWKEHADKIDRKAIYEFTCAGCGKSFTAYGNSKRKYCSHECYIIHRFGGGASGD